ncbi:MAG: RluA family pseudouridine synthase [Longimicrobiales bacterium]
MAGRESVRYVLAVEADTNERLDAYLATRLPAVSRTRVAALIEQGRVLVNGVAPRKRDQPRAGDRIEIEVPAAAPSDLVPEAIPLAIVFEDEHLLVVDKPAGLVVHPAVGHPTGTLANALAHHFGILSSVAGPARPGIVHRLDKDTSGLLLVARNDEVHRRLSAMLKRRTVRRSYTVAVWGHLAQQDVTVEAALGRSPSNRKRVAVLAGGKPAITHFTRLERWRAADLLEARLETGRTHQIRVHLLSIGHPVVGDVEYAGGAERGLSGPARPWARQLAARVPRQFLHASSLVFTHPITRQVVSLESSLPPDLAAAAQWARTTGGVSG